MQDFSNQKFGNKERRGQILIGMLGSRRPGHQNNLDAVSEIDDEDIGEQDQAGTKAKIQERPSQNDISELDISR